MLDLKVNGAQPKQTLGPFCSKFPSSRFGSLLASYFFGLQPSSSIKKISTNFMPNHRPKFLLKWAMSVMIKEKKHQKQKNRQSSGTGKTCKKILCYMSRWRIVKKAKLFWSYAKHFNSWVWEIVESWLVYATEFYFWAEIRNEVSARFFFWIFRLFMEKNKKN